MVKNNIDPSPVKSARPSLQNNFGSAFQAPAKGSLFQRSNTTSFLDVS